MKVIATKIIAIGTDTGRVMIETDSGQFFKNYSFDTSGDISFEDADSFTHLFEEHEDEYLELDEMDFSDIVRNDASYVSGLKEIRDEEKYFKVSCGSDLYKYNGVSRSDF